MRDRATAIQCANGRTTPDIKAGCCLLAAALALSICCAQPLNVMDFGARADGVSDDTAAFQRALDDADGRSVYAPASSYLIEGTIAIPAGGRLIGDYAGPGGPDGTILLSTTGEGTTQGAGCIIMNGGRCAVEGLCITYPRQRDELQEGHEPIRYPYAITGCPSARIENVCLYNPYLGIDLDFCHLNLVRNVWGEPLRVGINANHISDISRIENVHFWPYYTHGRPGLRQWVQNNGVAFQFGRSDWQSCINTFSYGYHTGYRFYEAADVRGRPGGNGGVTNGSFVGIGADRCVIALDVENIFAIGVSVTNGMFGPFGAWEGSRAILMREGNTGNLTMSNCNFWAVPATLAQIDGGSLNMTACNIHEWAVGIKDVPCFIANSGRLNVSNCTFNRGGYLARLRGDGTHAMFIGNMATDPLTVSSSIGDRLLLANNLPPVELLQPGSVKP